MRQTEQQLNNLGWIWFTHFPHLKMTIFAKDAGGNGGQIFGILKGGKFTRVSYEKIKNLCE